ncbi:hypothetical protein [Actinoplanes sp. NPDC026670]
MRVEVRIARAGLARASQSAGSRGLANGLARAGQLFAQPVNGQLARA